MTPKDIVLHLQKLFDPTTSPGTAFDALFKMRQERVTWDDAYSAVTTNGRAIRTLQRLDESEEFECPNCGVSRSNKDYCLVPSCPDFRPQAQRPQAQRPNGQPTRIERGEEPKFKNPKPTFGKYQDKTLLEIAAINPGYLSWIVQNHDSEFWKEQARLAQIAAEALAPPGRDTSDTGYFR